MQTKETLHPILRHFLALGLFILTLVMGTPTFAAPSLAGGDRKTYELTKGRLVTVIMDHLNPFQWFYMPEGLLLGRNPSGESSFQLLRYSFDGATPASPRVEGGILQFSSAYTQVRGNDLTRLRAMIAADLLAKRAVDPDFAKLIGDTAIDQTKINVGNMPFSDVEIAMYAPGTAEGPGQLIAKSSLANAGPKFGSQSMPFTLELTSNGTAVYDALTSGPTGVNVLYKVKYMGAAEKQGFSVDVNFKKAHEHFSRNITQKTSFAANVFGVDIEAAVGSDNLTVVNELKDSGAIDIKISPGAQITLEEIYKFMNPILDKIYAEVFATSPFEMVKLDQSAKAAAPIKEAATIANARKEQKQAPSDNPPKDEPAPPKTEEGDPPSTEGGEGEEGNDAPSTGLEDENVAPNIVPSIRTEVNIATKDIKQVSEKIYKVDFNFRPMIEESTVVAGFIGLPRDSDRGRHVTLVEGSSFDQATLVMPSINDTDAQALAIQSIGVEIFLAEPNGQVAAGDAGKTRTATYKPGSGWTVAGEALTPARMNFGVTGFRDRADKASLRYIIKATVSRSKTGVPPIVVNYDFPFFAGVKELPSPLQQITTVQLDLSTMPLTEYSAALVFFTPQGGRPTPPTRVDTAAFDYMPVSFLAAPGPNGATPLYDVRLQLVGKGKPPYIKQWTAQDSLYLVLQDPPVE